MCVWTKWLEQYMKQMTTSLLTTEIAWNDNVVTDVVSKVNLTDQITNHSLTGNYWNISNFIFTPEYWSRYFLLSHAWTSAGVRGGSQGGRPPTKILPPTCLLVLHLIHAVCRCVLGRFLHAQRCTKWPWKYVKKSLAIGALHRPRWGA